MSVRLFKDGRGLLRRMRWLRVIAVTAAFGAGVSWARLGPEAARLEAPPSVAPIDDALRGGIRPGAACKECGLGSSRAALIDGVGIGGVKQGYVFVDSCPIPAAVGLPVGK